ncbi:MAG: glycoside hydrolase family 99-like domain-containing protein [Candidatus Rifleibacteriota bacterium]
MKNNKPLVAAYYYPGWHPCKVRDSAFPKNWSEWDLVYNCKPRFPGHDQPNIPLWGRENEADPEVFAKKIETASVYGVDAFVFAFYWSRGKRLLEGALNCGLLQSKNKNRIKFAIMWANRMPRKVMPVKDREAKVIDPSRLVYTDPHDFVEFIKLIADRYFTQPNYLRLDDSCYLSIFDTAFFIRQLGIDNAIKAVAEARKFLADQGFKLHLAAIDPIPEHQPHLQKIGFNSVTHYVFLPDWKGEYLQDFNERASKSIEKWAHYQPATALPYFPSVSPGWDANPRAVDYGKEKTARYPWSPIIVNRSPENFRNFFKAAWNFAMTKCNFIQPLVFVSSWNEWSEGHYLEPDQKYGFEWLKAIQHAKN